MIRPQELNAFSDNYIWYLFDENKNALVMDSDCSCSVEQSLAEHNCKAYDFKEAHFEFVDYELVDTVFETIEIPITHSITSYLIQNPSLIKVNNLP